MKIIIGNGEISVIQGDITEQETDAIVNAANNHLWMGGGVAGAIKRRGGGIIEKEAVSQGPVEVGKAVITTGGDLKAKYVIHAAGMGQDLKTDQTKIKNSTYNSLKLAEEKGLSSIAFPAIGTGVGGFSSRKCANIMLKEAVDFLQSAKNLKNIVFVLYDNSTCEAFKDELENMFSANR